MTQLATFDVRQEWDSILPGLLYIKDKCDPDWRPEDLYAACIAKRMHLFKPNAGSSDFLLLAQNVSVYTGDAYLIVIAAYSKSGDAIATFQSQMDEIAREAGCKWMEFHSPRTGWERHARQFGFEPRETKFRRML